MLVGCFSVAGSTRQRARFRSVNTRNCSRPISDTFFGQIQLEIHCHIKVKGICPKIQNILTSGLLLAYNHQATLCPCRDSASASVEPFILISNPLLHQFHPSFPTVAHSIISIRIISIEKTFLEHYQVWI